MNRRILWLGIIFVVASLLLGGSMMVVQARPGQAASALAGRGINQAGDPETGLIPAVNLGQPGLSYRYVQTFGETEVAYLSDQLHTNYPWGLGTDGTNVWIGEYWGNRALKYTSTGSFQMQIGLSGYADIYDTVIMGITDVAVDGSGNIWVVDGDSYHVLKFDPSGNKIGELGAAWEAGSANNRFGQPQSIAFDAGGNIYVSDGAPWWCETCGNHRVQIFDNAENYLATIGQTGTCGFGDNQLCGPRHIAVYGNQLFVTDSGNHRVQIFDISNPASPTYAATMGVSEESGSDNSHFNNPSGIALDTEYIYVADSWNNRVQIFSRATRIYMATIGADWGSSNTQFKYPSDVVVDTAGNLYVADFVNTRVQQFSKVGSIWNYARTYGVTGVPYITDSSHFNRPSGVDIYSDGSIYITEESGHRLIKLNANGELQWVVGAAGVKGDWDSSDYRLNNPADVALDSNGKAYVADRWHGRIQIYNPDGSYFASVNDLNCPGGVAISNNNSLYVADSCDHAVKIYNSSLTLVAIMGTPGSSGSDNSHFNSPEDVTTDGNGLIYVADSANHRIQVFSATRAYMRTMGVPTIESSDFSHFNWPNGLYVDNANRLFVADDDRIQVFDSSGAYLTSIGGSWGNLQGQVQAPNGVAIDRSGNVYIADWGNHRIQKYAPGVPGWKQVNINGFGERGNGGLFAMEVFGGQLYAAVSNWNSGATIWRTSDTNSWTRISEPGFSAAYTNTNPAILDMIEFKGNLYAGTGWSGVGGQIWRSPDGTAWTQVMGDGFGSSENTMGAFTIFNDVLYVGTGAGTTHGTEIWRSSSGDSASWTRVVSDGFNGNINNLYVTGFATFNGYLYALVENRVDGPEVWRTDNGTSWGKVNTSGFGVANNQDSGGVVVFKDELYVTMKNSVTGGQLWRTANGTTWTQVIGNGFGDLNNVKIEGVIVFEDQLYAITSNSTTGVEVWRSSDGITWTQINPDGFGDSNNEGTLWSDGIVSFKNSLFIGISNWANGGEVWQMLKQVYLPLITKNYQSSLISQWRVVSNPTTKDLNSIFMVSANDGWTVGNDGTILRWNGSQWSNFSSPTTNHLQALIIISPSDGWAVGNGGKILRWNGSAWNLVSSPTTNDLYDVKMISSNNGWAVGNGGVTLRWNGAIWSQVASPTDRDLRALDFIDANDGWAVGGMWDTSINWYQEIVLHWNGSNWTVDPGVNIQPDIVETVDFISSTDGWVAGGNNLMDRRVGTNWTYPSGHPNFVWFESLEQLSANEVWTVGFENTKKPIARWDGSSWTQFTIPTATNVGLYAIDMLSSNEGWAVGQNGTIIHYSP